MATAHEVLEVLGVEGHHVVDHPRRLRLGEARGADEVGDEPRVGPRVSPVPRVRPRVGVRCPGARRGPGSRGSSCAQQPERASSDPKSGQN